MLNRKLDTTFFSWRIGLLLVGLLGLQLASARVAPILLIVLALWATTGPKRALQALSILPLILFTNPGLFEKDPLLITFRWLVLLGALGGVFLGMLKHGFSLPTTAKTLFIFVVVVIGLSVFASYAPDVSIAKAISFGLGASVCLIGFHLTRGEAEFWERWFSTIFITLIVLSIPLLVSPIGYNRNDSGFQGILQHPQMLGIVLVPFLLWYVGKMIEVKTRPVLTFIFLLVTGLGFVILSESRTAGLGLVVGFLMLISFGILRDRNQRRKALRFCTHPVSLLAGILVVICIMIFWSPLIDSVQQYVYKGPGTIETQEELYERAEASRGELIEISMRNFSDNPVTGIGFGMHSNPYKLKVERTEFLNIPTAATIEKGFLWSAILEEIGIIGFVAFIVFLLTLFRSAIRSDDPAGMGMLAGAVFVNHGEMVLFSIGGIGGFFWVLIAYGATSPGKTDREPGYISASRGSARNRGVRENGQDRSR